MKIRTVTSALGGIALSALLASAVLGQNETPAEAPGVTAPEEIVAARTNLMLVLEQLMIPLDYFTAGDDYPLDMLQANAENVGTLMTITPHLFPPSTNLYDPDAEVPETLALPAIWEDFATFRAMSEAASATALAAASESDPDAFLQAALDIRATCTACHDQFVRAYVPETVNDDDLTFDFGAFQ